MKNLILFILLTFSLTVFGQNNEVEEYCSIQMPSYFSDKKGFYVTVDYGTRNFNQELENIKDKDGKAIKFFTTMQVVNYMSLDKWSLLIVSPTMPKESSILSPSEYSKSLFIFKRKVVVKKDE